MQHYLIPRKMALICAAIFLLLIIVNMTGMVPIEKVTGAIPVFCPFKVVTGIDCPGCGMTRAITSLIDGRPGDAFLYNPFCFLLIFILLASSMPERWMQRIPAATHILPAFYAAMLPLILVFWVFDRLLPHVH